MPCTVRNARKDKHISTVVESTNSPVIPEKPYFFVEHDFLHSTKITFTRHDDSFSEDALSMGWFCFT
jgi:hypothetical protein